MISLLKSREDLNSLFEKTNESEEGSVYASSQGMFESNEEGTAETTDIGDYELDESKSSEGVKKTKTIYAKNFDEYLKNSEVKNKLDEFISYAKVKGLKIVGREVAQKLKKKLFSPKIPNIDKSDIEKYKKMGINTYVIEKKYKSIPIICTYCQVDNAKVGTVQLIFKYPNDKYKVMMVTSDVIMH